MRAWCLHALREKPAARKRTRTRVCPAEQANCKIAASTARSRQQARAAAARGNAKAAARRRPACRGLREGLGAWWLDTQDIRHSSRPERGDSRQATATSQSGGSRAARPASTLPPAPPPPGPTRAHGLAPPLAPRSCHLWLSDAGTQLSWADGISSASWRACGMAKSVTCNGRPFDAS